MADAGEPPIPEEEVPPPPADDADDPPPQEEEVPALQGSRGEVSHSPLRGVADARKRFEASQEEEVAKKPKEGGASKSVGVPKASGGKYKYADLKLPGSKLTKDHIDITTREDYLSKEEFEELFECSRDEFAKLPQWKKESKKKAVGLF